MKQLLRNAVSFHYRACFPPETCIIITVNKSQTADAQNVLDATEAQNVRNDCRAKCFSCAVTVNLLSQQQRAFSRQTRREEEEEGDDGENESEEEEEGDEDEEEDTDDEH